MSSVPPQHIAPQSRRLHGVALAAVIASLMLTLLLEALDQTVVGTALLSPPFAIACMSFNQLDR